MLDGTKFSVKPFSPCVSAKIILRLSSAHLCLTRNGLRLLEREARAERLADAALAANTELKCVCLEEKSLVQKQRQRGGKT